MFRRPLTVKIACAFIFVQLLGAILGAISIFRPIGYGEDSFASSPLSLPFRQGFAVTHILCLSAFLIFILMGKPAARIGYTAWGAVAMIYLIVLVNFRVLAVLPPIGFYALIVVLLFLPASRAYFAARR